MIDWFFHGDFATSPTNIPAVLVGLLLSFICGHVVAWTYVKTHSGLSFSRTFVGSLVVIPVVVSMVMMVLQNNLITAFGMMAVFAIVRFRNVLRDTMDTTYILCVIASGMACGTQKYATAVLGVAIIMGIVLYLHFTAFGTRHRYDLIVNLHWSRALSELAAVKEVFVKHSRRSLCASQRANEGYAGTDLSYRLLMRDPERVEELLIDLRSVPGVSRVTSLQALDESEM
jgi:uncharacterized membrane protein YhiD involved in acid resistance